MEKSMSMFKRIMAVLLVLTMIAGNMPLGVLAEEAEPLKESHLETDIKDGMVFALDEPTPFYYKTVPSAEDNGQKMVKGSFSITKDGVPVNMQDVAKLEYYESGSDSWIEFYTDFGPADGFKLQEVTSNFRITFREAGNYEVTVSIKEVGKEILFSDTKSIKAEFVKGTVSSTLPADNLMVNQEYVFDVKTDANSYFGKYVVGAFVVMEGDTVVNVADVADLKYYEVKDGNWYPLTGDFGPSTGFPLVDTASRFSITFKKAGEYKVHTELKFVNEADQSLETIKDEATLIVNFVDSVVATDLPLEHVTGRYTPFSVKMAGNSNVGAKAVAGIVVYKDDQPVVLDEVLILECETEEGWVATSGKFPTDQAFELAANAMHNLRIAFKKAGTYTVCIRLWNEQDGKELGSTKVTLTVTDPTAEYFLKTGDTYTAIEDKWYGSVQTITVKMDNVLSQDSLAGVLVNGMYYAGQWNNDGSNNWTFDVPMEASGTVQYGDQAPVSIKIDTMVPIVEILSSKTVGGKNKTTLGTYKITVGMSDLLSVSIETGDGDPIPVDFSKATRVDNQDGTFTYIGEFAIAGKHIDLTLKATSGAGNTGSDTTAPQPELNISFTGTSAILGNVDNVQYLAKDNQEYVKILVTGTTENGEYAMADGTVVTAKDQNNADISVQFNWSAADSGWVAMVPLTNGLNSLSVKFVDNSGREEEGSFDGKYAIDLEAPVVNVTRSVPEGTVSLTVGATEYFNNEVTYTFTVEDVLLGDNNVTIMYTLDGEEAKAAEYVDGQWIVTVPANRTLTGISVTAVDLTGNPTTQVFAEGFTWGDGMEYQCAVVVDKQAPEISAEITGNVSDFYFDGASYFAVVTPVISDNENEEAIESEKITLKITVSDTYLLKDNLLADGAEWVVTEDGKTATIIFESEVNAHDTAALKFNFTVQDALGWYAENELRIECESKAREGFCPGFTVTPDEKHAYVGEILIDRRAPGSENVVSDTPDLAISDNYTFGTEYNLYDRAFDFIVTINDFVYVEKETVDENGETVTEIVGEGYNSGVQSIKWYINDGTDDRFKQNSGELEAEKEVYIPIRPIEGFEDSDIVLKIVAIDAVGNTFTYYKHFAVDTKAPVISVEYDNNEVYTTDNVQHYNADRTATITITDLFLDSSSYSIKLNGNEMDLSDYAAESVTNGVKYVVPLNNEGQYEIKVEATDKTQKKTAKSDAFIIDKTAPEITVEKSVENGKYVKTIDGVDYYDGIVTYNVTVTDKYLSTGEGETYNKLVVSYQLEASSEPVTVEMQREYDENTGLYTYKGEFSINNNDVMTSMSVVAVDNANNESKYVYNDNPVAVDTVDPEITVEKSGEFVHTYMIGDTNRDYYADNVTYTINIKDNFLNPGVCVVTVTYADGESVNLVAEQTETAEQEEDSALLANEESYTYTIELDGQKVLENISFQVVDNAGRVAALPVVTDNDGKTTFEIEDGKDTWNYNGNPVVVDKDAPVTYITFSENVKGFYTNGNTVYAILEQTENGEVDLQENNTQNVTMTIVVTDNNVAIDNGNDYGVKENGDGAWKYEDGAPKVNQENILTYTFSTANIPVNQVCKFDVNVVICDLAGNTANNGAEVDVSNTGLKPVIKFGEKGALEFIVSLDRRSPGSTDSDAPEIKLESIAPVYTDGAYELYDRSFNFTLDVYDRNAIATEDAIHAGIAEITWTLRDGLGKVNVVDGRWEPDEDGKWVSAVTGINIPVVIKDEIGETDSLVLVIEAVDNVGNTIHFEKKFGVDNFSPRVTFTTEQNTRGGNYDGYFNVNRFITMTVEDLNFNAGNTSITTEGAAGIPDGWTELGNNTYSKTISYVSDGTYSLSGVSTDLAGNTTEKGNENYNDSNVNWIDNFVIDKTAPVINVTYDPAMPIDTDPMGVQYFDRDRVVVVSITELNFNTNEVVADLGAANALSAWASNGIIRTATETFTEGNNYRVAVSYTDMAGNPAVQNYTGPMFSVDLHAPEVLMSKGSLTSSELNPISGDLVLGFTATDNEQNMKSVDVQVTFIGENFVTKTVEGNAYYTKSYENERLTHYIDFEKIAAEKANDGIYTVIVTATDYAGHITTYDTIYFSLNRFGSVFTTDHAYTRAFLDSDNTGVAFQNAVTEGLVIHEINPNQVWQNADHTDEGSIITIAVNGNSTTLVKGTDYTVETVQRGDGMQKWYEYIYTINPSVFYENDELIDGEYTVFFYSEDNAGNKNTNESNYGPGLKLGEDGTYSGKISFTLDHLSPVVTVLGITEGGSIQKANQDVEINVSDNSPVGISVYINGELVEYVEVAEGKELNSDWFTFDPSTGSYKLNMSQKNSRQDVKIVVTDQAGNEQVMEVNDVMLNQSLWYQYINSTPALIVTAVAVAGLILLIVLLIKKRKKDTEEAAV